MSICRETAFSSDTMSVHHTSLILLVAHFCVLCVARATEVTTRTYIEEGGGWFKLHRVPLDWQTARLQCYHEGAVLASPLDDKLWSTLKKILSEARPNVRRVTSIEGIPLEKLRVQWALDQPNNLGRNQQCIVYNETAMDDYNCEELLPYICYRRPSSVPDQLSECGTVDKEYKLDARTGHCYKMHVRAEIWWRALRICQAEGGHLAVIDNEVEADVLKELFARHPHLLYTAFQGSASVSFRDWGFHKSWWTIHGKMLEDTEYAQWTRGQPNNLRAPDGRKSRQGCGAMDRNGQLNDIWCDEPLAFICEKTTHSLLHDVSDEIE